jgi:poly-gamma-glutamate capsule biosynthesis protein CapA/YwtB (metallophosphatase superfamily)
MLQQNKNMSSKGFLYSMFSVILMAVSIFFAYSLKVNTSNSFSQTRPSQSTLGKVEEAKKSQQLPVQILFGGDLMFDRSIRTALRKRGNDFPLAPLREILTGADRVVANLEGPITDNVSLSETSAIGAHDNYFFTFDPSVASLLKEFHIGPVNIGNNHILNFKEAGVTQTKRYLSEAGVDSFGSPLSGDQRFILQEIKGVKIAFVNYNQFVWQGKEKTFADIASAKQLADVVILYTHWGTEYVQATESVKTLAHQFIDAGADLIIGSHPHVVQEKEIYQGKTIYYSLGNMVFDQYFSTETEHGLLVRATLDTQTKHFSFEEIPLILKSNGQTSIDSEKGL